MKILASIILALGITLSGTTTEITGPMKAHETISKTVELEQGNTTIDISSSIDGGKISCYFSDISSILNFEQLNTTQCFMRTNSKLSTPIMLVVVNEENKSVEYKIVIHQP